jgi:outer membrane murein-binding lipoprotein Lpp
MRGKWMLPAIVLSVLWISGCSSMHDGQGWDHSGDPETHQDDQPYTLEHKH